MDEAASTRWIPSCEILSASENSIARYYNACESQLVARRVSQNLLVKMCLNQREFQNQSHAWTLLDGTAIGGGRTLRIPRPMRYVEHEHIGYIIMEYLDGVTMEDDGICKENIPYVANAISKIHEKTSLLNRERPGPLDGGYAVGFPWGEWSCETTFDTIMDLQKCVDKRLRRDAASRASLLQRLPLCNRTLSFCHMDIVFRNILLMPNNDIAFLDWEYANYYPAEFDMASLWYGCNLCPKSKKPLMRDLAELVTSQSIHRSDCDTLLVVQAQSIQSQVSALFPAMMLENALDSMLMNIVYLKVLLTYGSCLYAASHHLLHRQQIATGMVLLAHTCGEPTLSLADKL